jgi:Zn/Cd-binding protein ZinT
MILVDMHQVVLSNIFAMTKNTDEISEDLVRHVTLNNLRIIRKQFGDSYGNVVLTFDAGNYWRKDIFEHYKKPRKMKQSQSDFDWGSVFSTIRDIREEITETFPYKVMLVPRAEADDIIAYLAKRYHTEEKIMIISSDKDFQQLQRYPNIEQFSPRTKKKLTCKDPEAFLKEHIIRGDSSDGIPNILSDSDTFVDPDKRQKRLTQKMMNSIHEDLAFGEAPKGLESNWDRNQSMIDFEKIPEWLVSDIEREWDKPINGHRSKLFNYFVTKRLKNLMEHIEEF